MAYYLVRDDLVSMEVDCIVASANVNLKMVEGVTRAIFHKAGDLKMLHACREIGHCDVGNAVLTPSFDITNTKAIIHAVGPNYINGKHGEEANLKKAYQKTFSLMDENNFKSAAFPVLSSDFNYPFKEAYLCGRNEILNRIKLHKDNDIYVVLYKDPFMYFDDDKRSEIQKFINSNFKTSSKRNEIVSNNKNIVKELDKLLKEKEMSDEELTYNGNLELNFLTTLRNDETFIPSKGQMLSMALALKLNENEITSFLSVAGYVFGNNNFTDLIIRYCLFKGINNLYDINDALFAFLNETLSIKVL